MPNLVMQHYDVVSSNYILCIDITVMGNYGEVFVVMDLASRCVIGHCYSSIPLDTDVICEVLSDVIRKRSFLPEINIIHSDRGSVFRNEDFISFLDSQNIQVSRGSSKGHQNQVIERFFRTLKDRIRSFLRPNWRALKAENLSWDPLKDMDISKEEFLMVVKQEIEAYNCTPHSNFKRKASPNEMEEALFLKHGNRHPEMSIEENIPLTSMSNSDDSLDIEIYKEKVLAEYRGDWPTFFREWRSEQQVWQAKTTKELKDANERYETLYAQYLNLQAVLEEVHQESMRQKAAEEAKQAQRLKRQNRKKDPLRATISIVEFEGILNMVNGRSELIKSRRRLALGLLFLTGLRVSNLLILTVLNGKELFCDGRTTISLIKGGEKRHKLILTTKGRNFLKNFNSDYENLSSNKKGSNLIFSAPKDNDMPFNSELFDRELNAILSKASTLYEKHLRTHSFRATFITDLLESVPIEDVKEVVGHKHISTTLEYKRSRLNDLEKKSILKTRDNYLKKSK